MRQIKFRAKRLDNGEWAYGGLVEADDYCIIDQGNELYVERDYVFRGDTHFFQLSGVMCDEKTIGQFTGLLDRNGKEIYEGDIITVKGSYPRVVLWDKMMWALMPTEYYHDEVFWVMNLQHPGVDWWEEFADEFEIIGNIHDNPELISDKQ